MTGLEDVLRLVLETHGWTVITESHDARAKEFDLIAENQSAIVFVYTSASTRLEADSRRLGARIASLMQESPSEKSWEAYLVLLVPLLTDNDQGMIGRVQRDLTFCRRVLIETRTVTGARNTAAELEQRLGFLFPLSLTDVTATPDAPELLRLSLVQRGSAAELVTAMLDGIDDPKFDPIAYLTDLRTEQP